MNLIIFVVKVSLAFKLIINRWDTKMNLNIIRLLVLYFLPLIPVAQTAICETDEKIKGMFVDALENTINFARQILVCPSCGRHLDYGHRFK